MPVNLHYAPGKGRHLGFFHLCTAIYLCIQKSHKRLCSIEMLRNPQLNRLLLDLTSIVDFGLQPLLLVAVNIGVDRQ